MSMNLIIVDDLLGGGVGYTEQRTDEGAGCGNHCHRNRGRCLLDRRADRADKRCNRREGDETDPLEDVIYLVWDDILHNFPFNLGVLP